MTTFSDAFASHEELINQWQAPRERRLPFERESWVGRLERGYLRGQGRKSSGKLVGLSPHAAFAKEI